MKSLSKTLFLSILALIVSVSMVKAEDYPTKIYAYGVCGSIGDSILYITEIHEVDSAWVNRKTKFLYSRENYSAQLREYMDQVEGVRKPTCSITFAFDRKKIDKKMARLRKRYAKKGGFLIKEISAADFTFSAIAAADEYVPLTKAERKAERKADKQAAREKKKAAKAARKNGRPNKK